MRLLLVADRVYLAIFLCFSDVFAVVATRESVPGGVAG